MDVITAASLIDFGPQPEHFGHHRVNWTESMLMLISIVSTDYKDDN